MKIPIHKFKMLYHVGELDAQPLVNSRSSYEGPCLSVSEVPNAWRAIARLGDAPLWKLTKNENQFLNMHRMSKALKEAVLQWGTETGLTENREGWVTELSSSDEDGMPYTRLSLSATYEMAVRDFGADGDDDVSARYTLMMPFATEKLSIYARQKVDLMLATDMLTLAYAEQVLGLDGVFWDEELDVLAYSAPRAGIFPRKLSSWTVTQSATSENHEEVY